MKRKVGIIKRALCIGLVFLFSINSFAAVVSDNDGSAFITKAEFDSLKNSFQSQIDQYNTSIDSKIDGAIAQYLAGIKTSTKPLCHVDVMNSDYIYKYFIEATVTAPSDVAGFGTLATFAQPLSILRSFGSQNYTGGGSAKNEIEIGDCLGPSFGNTVSYYSNSAHSSNLYLPEFGMRYKWTTQSTTGAPGTSWGTATAHINNVSPAYQYIAPVAVLGTKNAFPFWVLDSYRDPAPIRYVYSGWYNYSGQLEWRNSWSDPEYYYDGTYPSTGSFDVSKWKRKPKPRFKGGNILATMNWNQWKPTSSSGQGYRYFTTDTSATAGIYGVPTTMYYNWSAFPEQISWDKGNLKLIAKWAPSTYDTKLEYFMNWVPGFDDDGTKVAVEPSRTSNNKKGEIVKASAPSGEFVVFDSKTDAGNLATGTLGFIFNTNTNYFPGTYDVYAKLTTSKILWKDLLTLQTVDLGYELYSTDGDLFAKKWFWKNGAFDTSAFDVS